MIQTSQEQLNSFRIESIDPDVERTVANNHAKEVWGVDLNKMESNKAQIAEHFILYGASRAMMNLLSEERERQENMNQNNGQLVLPGFN